jgi:hypothetical protein
MENLEDIKKQKQFERIYSAVFLLIVALLILASILYTTQLWLAKVFIALTLLGFSAFFAREYFRGR